MISQEIFDVIKSDKILGYADKNNLEKCFDKQNVYAENFAAGDTIYSPECRQRQIGIILEGRAAVEPTNSNEKVLLKILSERDMFGVANLYASELPFISVIIAKSTCRVLFIDADAFRALLESDAKAMRAYLEFMSRKIVFLNKKISTLTAGTTEKKLAFFLAENQHGGKFSSQIPMTTIAETLSIGRASLYRALDSLEAQGLIRRDGKTVFIPDKDALLSIE